LTSSRHQPHLRPLTHYLETTVPGLQCVVLVAPATGGLLSVLLLNESERMRGRDVRLITIQSTDHADSLDSGRSEEGYLSCAIRRGLEASFVFSQATHVYSSSYSRPGRLVVADTYSYRVES